MGKADLLSRFAHIGLHVKCRKAIYTNTQRTNKCDAAIVKWHCIRLVLFKYDMSKNSYRFKIKHILSRLTKKHQVQLVQQLFV